jgi:hypothetical protein
MEDFRQLNRYANIKISRLFPLSEETKLDSISIVKEQPTEKESNRIWELKIMESLCLTQIRKMLSTLLQMLPLEHLANVAWH